MISWCALVTIHWIILFQYDVTYGLCSSHRMLCFSNIIFRTQGCYARIQFNLLYKLVYSNANIYLVFFIMTKHLKFKPGPCRLGGKYHTNITPITPKVPEVAWILGATSSPFMSDQVKYLFFLRK